MKHTAFALLIALGMTACSKDAPETEALATAPAQSETVAPPTPAAVTTDPAVAGSVADTFMQNIAALCGQAYAGRVLVDKPESADNSFAGKPLVMHVRQCDDGQIRIPFHVGDDHSRTWVISRRDQGLYLKHDHRHADGSSDAVTLYGGASAAPGTATRQSFPVDAQSSAMFDRAGLSASMSNTWAMEIEPGKRFLYELSRPDGRLFQVEFDLTTPVAEPPAPWGADSGGSPW
jgi:hypothetical protein